MKKLLKVILDCDDVLFQCNQYALDKLNEEEGTDFKKEDIKTWGITNTVLDKRLKYFENPNFIQALPLYEGAKEFVHELSKWAEIFICTNVSVKCAGIRYNQIVENFPEIDPGNILIGGRKDLLQGDIMLDDAAHNLINANVDYPVLFRQPWNCSSTGLISVSTYGEFLSFVKMICTAFKEIEKVSILTFVGPSGSGKTTLKKKLLKDYPLEYCNIVSYTTRKKREHEIDGVDYHFISEEKFLQLKEEGRFFETSVYMGDYYGSTYETIHTAVLQGYIPLLILDINGAIAIKQHFPTAVNIYVERDKEECIRSILLRNIAIDEKVKRVSSLDAEMRNEEFCDAKIKNIGNPEDVVNQLLQLVKREISNQ